MYFFFLSCQENLEELICRAHLDVFWSLLCNLGQIAVWKGVVWESCVLQVLWRCPKFHGEGYGGRQEGKKP